MIMEYILSLLFKAIRTEFVFEENSSTRTHDSFDDSWLWKYGIVN